MEIEKFHNLLSASWKPRKAGGIISVQSRRPEDQKNQRCKFQPESEGLRTKGAEGVSPSPKSKED